ncbi:MAG: malate dehydrogenase [Candidatus Bathyarchaeia archaeon]|nr:malate dehydrogenase [Candidatus Bathyarchaeota archaeon]
MRGKLKASVIGTGNLGSCIAYELANRGIFEEIVLVDIIRGLAEGNALDIGQAIALRNNTEVYAGDYSDVEGSYIIVVTAGKPRTPEMKTRLELLEVNKRIISDVAQNLRRIGGDAIIVTLTNPVDIMNYLMWKYTGFPRERIIGSAGMLDSARLRYILSRKFGVPVLDVEAYVIGEHGDAQVPVFSKVRVRGEARILGEAEKFEIMDEIRRSALEIISKKGATIYAPANNTVNMIEGIIRNEGKLYVCSAILNGEYNLRDISIGVPAILGSDGVEEIVEWDLDEDEKKMFYSGAESIRRTIESIL